MGRMVKPSHLCLSASLAAFFSHWSSLLPAMKSPQELLGLGLTIPLPLPDWPLPIKPRPDSFLSAQQVLPDSPLSLRLSYVIGQEEIN